MLRLIEATAGQVLVGARVRHSVRHLYHRRRQHVPSQPGGRDPRTVSPAVGNYNCMGLLLFAHEDRPDGAFAETGEGDGFGKIHVLCVAL